MRCNLSKLLTIGVFCGPFIFFGLNGSPADAFSSGPLASRTGAPALGSFPQEANCTACHAGTVNSGGGTLTITAPANYSPNQDVAVTVTINQTGRALFGFQLTALNDQINYLVPVDTAIGAATITIRRNGVDTAQGTVNIDTVSPGLFSANANGQGVVAAVILRRRNGVDTFEPVATLNAAANRFDPVQIDLGPPTDMVALIAFGTGFQAASQSAVSATIGGTPSPFVATAAAPNFFGLDQANILIPRSLIGSGLVNVVFTANGKAANPVQISIK